MPQQCHQFLPPVQPGTGPGAVGLAGRARDFHPLAGSLQSTQESISGGGFDVLVLPCDTGPALTQPLATLVPGTAPGSGPTDHTSRRLPLPVMTLGGLGLWGRCLGDAGAGTPWLWQGAGHHRLRIGGDQLNLESLSPCPHSHQCHWQELSHASVLAPRQHQRGRGWG